MLLRKTEQTFLIIACLLLLVMMTVMCLETFLRYVFRSPIPSYWDLVQEIFMPYIVFLSIGFVYSSGHQIRITVFSKYLPEKINKIVLMAGDFLTALVFGAIAYGSLQRAINSSRMQEFASNIYGYPIWICYIIVFIGSIPLILHLLRAAILMKHPEPGTHDK